MFIQKYLYSDNIYIDHASLFNLSFFFNYRGPSYSFIFIFLTPAHSLWDLSSLTRDGTHNPALEVQSLSHWAAREAP